MRYPTAELREAGVDVLDCEHKTPKARNEGHPYIAIPDIQGGRVKVSGTRLISDSDLAEWTRRTKPREGDVLVTRRGRVGDTAPVPPGLDCAVGQNLVLLRSRGDTINQSYLRWAARSPQWWSEVERLLNVGAIFSSLNVKDIARIKIPVPPRAEQYAIAEVLGALDDKIAANIKTEGLLVELARANWARSAIGTELVPLGTVVEVGLSGVWGEDARTESATFEVYALRGRDLEDIARRRDATPPKRWITPSQAMRRIQNDSPEIWTAGSGSQLGPTLLVTNEFRQTHDLPVVYSNFVKRLVPVSGHEAQVPSAWFSMLLEWERSEFENFKIGTAFPNLDVGAMLAGIFVPVLIGDAIAQVKVWADLILRSELLDENRTLAATRDALLPHLMSGKLRVKDAEKVLREVL